MTLIPAKGDSFGDRMKAYEATHTNTTLRKDLPFYARLDGRAFSSFTRGMKRPFDELLYLPEAYRSQDSFLRMNVVPLTDLPPFLEITNRTDVLFRGASWVVREAWNSQKFF